MSVTDGSSSGTVPGPDLSSFGITYAAADGRKYIRIGITGVRLDACRIFKGTVKSFAEKIGVSGSTTGWWELKLEEYAETFSVHCNWVSYNGRLEPGEHVEGFIDTIDARSFWLLRRAIEQDTVL